LERRKMLGQFSLDPVIEWSNGAACSKSNARVQGSLSKLTSGESRRRPLRCAAQVLDELRRSQARRGRRRAPPPARVPQKTGPPATSSGSSAPSAQAPRAGNVRRSSGARGAASPAPPSSSARGPRARQPEPRDGSSSRARRGAAARVAPQAEGLGRRGPSPTLSGQLPSIPADDMARARFSTCRWPAADLPARSGSPFQGRVQGRPVPPRRRRRSTSDLPAVFGGGLPSLASSDLPSRAGAGLPAPAASANLPVRSSAGSPVSRAPGFRRRLRGASFAHRVAPHDDVAEVHGRAFGEIDLPLLPPEAPTLSAPPQPFITAAHSPPAPSSLPPVAARGDRRFRISPWVRSACRCRRRLGRRLRCAPRFATPRPAGGGGVVRGAGGGIAFGEVSLGDPEEAPSGSRRNRAE